MANDVALDQIFSAFADPTRRRIIERLSRRSMTAGEIAREFPISQPAISRHLRILEDTDLLQREIVGTTHYCSLTPAALDEAVRWIERQRKYWVASLDRLEAVLSKELPKRK